MSVTLHTTLGDLKIEIFCESVPKTAEVSFLSELRSAARPRPDSSSSPNMPRTSSPSAPRATTMPPPSTA
ncbi:peptidyl-prolyl cis-trans isomerase [Verticillium alfalfae VaMs.102]|uniref:Peptidyl-prolyl cis-trans isomerase n=1 Tax=Verticillium alfalfae (strain VaMs.102 / ATCC MYA-4576 / FGSC 10136) TaxID=526221 RepID=C9SAD2_VERA1|nr:peptidyl-prolyl cis-trans isomerase [Verticillium alfalfae VaMs.102]EEY15409.1 peptidyl-prolyl cis-trans isomerase [Verticillium alfalfae VaMs.102]